MNKRKVWIRVTDCQNIPLREGRPVRVAGHEVAIFNLGDRFLAVDNRCPHKGGPLAEGIVAGNTVVCPLHAWKVNLDTGAIVSTPMVLSCVETFQTHVENGFVLVELSVDSAGATGSAVAPTRLGGRGSEFEARAEAND